MPPLLGGLPSHELKSKLLNSFKQGSIGAYIEEYDAGYRGDARGVDYGPCKVHRVMQEFQTPTPEAVNPKSKSWIAKPYKPQNPEPQSPRP